MAVSKKLVLEEMSAIPADSVARAQEYLKLIQGTQDPNLIFLHCYHIMKLGGLDAEVPRLVVFGQQSMGKTTVLDFIMGGPIGYSSTDTGTKQPVVIIMRPLEVIMEVAAALKVQIDPANLKGGTIWCLFDGKLMDIRSVQDAMRSHMQSIGDRILADELEVEVFVPNGVNAIFVDLPGIKDDSKTGAEFTRNVVRNYVKNNPNDLYLLVKKSSDDPANWPWSLKEFITTAPPTGLGLSPHQTIVVGTRAREFLINEKTDIRTVEQLMDRVLKRTITDSKGNILPLHLLELFSLSIEAKESGDFLANKREMKRQIAKGHEEVENMIRTSFEVTNDAVGRDGMTVVDRLLQMFSINGFLTTLDTRYQALVATTFRNLERRLVRKKMELERSMQSLEQRMNRLSPQSIRESVSLFIRQFVEVVQKMITGNYTIMKLPVAPEEFLKYYGGSLRDNLEDGNELALNLFPQRDLYEPDFYEKISKRTETLFNKKLTMMDSVKPGRYVRYFTSKINAHMFGLIEPPRRNKSNSSDGIENYISNEYKSDEMINVEFIQINNGQENSLHKNIDRSRISLLTPLPSVSVDQMQVPLYAWHKTLSSTGWVLVRPIVIDRLPPEIIVQKSNYREIEIASKQIAFRYLDVADNNYSDDVDVDTVTEKVANASIKGAAAKENEKNTKAEADKNSRDGDKSARANEKGGKEADKASTASAAGEKDAKNNRYVYFTTCSEIFLEDPKVVPYYNSALEMVSGEHAEAQLLNQLAITNICHWLKFQIKHMEPDRHFTSEVIYQMLRSVHHVVDRADWEPLIADLVQSNVRGALLHAARLSACAAAAALRRVLKAALAEVFRCIQQSECGQTLYCLSESLHFQEQIDQLSEEYCRQKATDCAGAMMNLILEQTYSIQFDVAVDIFDYCYQFEKYIVGRAGHRSLMGEALYRVRENFAMRKRRLAMTDIFEKSDAKTSLELIYEEVKVQFWATKMLLASPLATKIYTHFIKDVVDRMGNEIHDPSASNEAELEAFLQKNILYESVDGNWVPRSNNRMSQDYDVNSKYDRFAQHFQETKNSLEYITIALEAIAAMKRAEGGPEFVTNLDKDLLGA
ncbi:arginyl-tRNA synthetase, putative [Babesia ovata]|uniref:Arginyl-tRNA synthetase, putative n=1 Tax=Babesia ovata TaxID=189622 RepID=A0A2H6KBH7_9APIC|nr:arginyl-tRNA synthetase, putative [Babesia ovata]GBE60348.1 arginyl-tRNA synthetase, putative [Babesia ovata]